MNRAHLLLALLCFAGCAGQGGDGTTDDCVGDKCDTPTDKPELSCQRRRADALSSGQKAYTTDFVRWACSDVAGVNSATVDSRGQEYCEYYAIVQPPPLKEGGDKPPAVDLGRKTSKTATTPPALTLTEDQVFWLEDHPTDVVGECVFTSWHEDVPGPYPACAGSSCPNILGFKITAEYMRMKDSVNSNSAANDLVKECYKVPAGGDPKNTADPLNDAYTRGCMIAHDNWGTEWRRSDPTLCAAMMRLAECGCGVDANSDGKPDLYGQDLADALVPKQPASGAVTLRGFPLGTWSGAHELPAGCRYVDIGESSQTLVTCDLTADDVLKNKTDPKGACRTKYGDDVVVHVPVPAAKIACKPPADGKYASTCPAQPWVL